MTLLGLFLSLSIIFSFPTWAESFEIIHQKGTVKITRQGKIISPPVLPGDQIEVLKGGLLVLKSEKIVLKIMQNTIIRPKEDKEGTVVDLIRGSMLSDVNKAPFKVRTRATAMGVRGTQFFVETVGKEDIWMCVNEGVVNVKNFNVKKDVDVPAGKGVFIGKKEISDPKAFQWTKGINWNMNPKKGKLEHHIKLKSYDPLSNFYD